MSTRADQIFVKFKRFHAENPKVWELFKKFSFELIRSGVGNYSSDAIFHRIRWHVSIETRNPDGLKLSNDLTAWYSRMFAACFPQHDGFFRRRKQPSQDKPASRNGTTALNFAPSEDSAETMAELRKLGIEELVLL